MNEHQKKRWKDDAQQLKKDLDGRKKKIVNRYVPIKGISTGNSSSKNNKQQQLNYVENEFLKNQLFHHNKDIN
jgi:hypothetical protein